MFRSVTQNCHKWWSLRAFYTVLRKYDYICKPVM